MKLSTEGYHVEPLQTLGFVIDDQPIVGTRVILFILERRLSLGIQIMQMSAHMVSLPSLGDIIMLRSLCCVFSMNII